MDPVASLQEQLPPLAKLLGIRVLSVAQDCLRAELEIRPELCTNSGAAHGGSLMAFADTLGAMATIVNLSRGAWTTTIESKTNFFAPAPAGTIVTGESLPLHRGRRTMVWQTRLTHPDGRLVAQVIQTQIVLEARPGDEGR